MRENFYDTIIKEHTNGEEFGCLMDFQIDLVKDDKKPNPKTFESHQKKITNLLKQYDYPYFYWAINQFMN